MSTNLMMDDDTELEGLQPQVGPASDEYADTAPESPIHYNLRTMSYSGLQTLLSCEKKYELSRLIPADTTEDNDENGHLDFGTIVGNGIQELLIHGDMDKALFQAFLTWPDNLESDRGLKSAKTFWHAVQAIEKFTELMYGPLDGYELAVFNGKPAVELGFRIDLGSGFVYRGKLDALLIHKVTREFLPLECKTTGWNVVHEAQYANSAQAIGYGIVIDAVAVGMAVEYNSYDVIYPVYKTKAQEWTAFRFPKSNTSRAKWLETLILDVMHIQQYAEWKLFPMRGGSCFSYNKPCRFFSTCTMATNLLVSDPKYIKVRYDKKEDYPLEFTFEELVQAQLDKE
jgi:PD-(D/E)XK nuclease superfamily